MTVTQLYSQVLNRIGGSPQCDLPTALLAVHNLIVNRLIILRSDLIISTQQLSFTAGLSSKDLATDFDSLESLPYYTSTTIKGQLSPLPRDKDKTSTSLTTSGSPKYFETASRKFYVYPPPSVSITVNIPAYTRPSISTTLTDSLPFNGVFDQTYADAVVGVINSGMFIVSNPAFSGMIATQVEQVTQLQQLAAEQIEADSINSGY